MTLTQNDVAYSLFSWYFLFSTEMFKAAVTAY